MHNIIGELIAKCKELDEDELNYITMENLIKIFEEVTFFYYFFVQKKIKKNYVFF